jgi:hypothetical protein
MIDYLKANHLVLLVIGFLVYQGFAAGTFGASPAANLTRITNPAEFQNDVDFSHGDVAIGSAGTNIDRLNTGTCYIKAYATTIAATSSAVVDCQATAAVSASGIGALAGVTFGDAVAAQLSTTTALGAPIGVATPRMGGLVIRGASASSTAGVITLLIGNETGDTYTWPLTGSATGTASYIVLDNN